MRKNYILFFLLLLSPVLSFASHLRAGEITATRISNTSLTYRVTLVTYTDEINGKNANDADEYATFNFGFSTNKPEKVTVKRTQKVALNRATIRNVYETVYTFPAAGYYTIACGIVNRNANTVNLPDPVGSDNISFFVQTSVLINANIGFNSTPVLLNTPIDSAALGQRFIHNPGAFDIDGDSLSYRLTTPRKDQGNETGIGEFIASYLEPNTVGPAPVLNQAGTGPATFTINPRTGDLIWDAPREIGQYNVAFVIEEWRKGYDGNYVKIGEIVRDMQIIVVDTDNKAPVVSLPPDICIEAGEKVEFEVIGEDENLQLLKLTTSGGVYNVDPVGNTVAFIAPEAAKFSSTPSIGKVVGKFEWNTNCMHARDQVYNVVFKVEDTPDRFSTQLVDIKSINIKVLPPRPRGLTAVAESNGNLLSWTKLENCKENGKILVYRRSGCSGLNPGECQSGMPGSWGYALIGEVESTATTFLDSAVDPEAIYSYRLVTQIAENSFINLFSAPSIEFCIGSEVKPGTSVITKVSVTETSVNAGKIEVNWSRPVSIDLGTLVGPFSYKLYRVEGIGGENYSMILERGTDLSVSADTVYTDQNLNTQDKVYRYKVEFYSEGTKLNGTSNAASSVRLTSRTGDKSVGLSWEANTPWSNEDKKHYIYREDPNNAGSYNLVKIVEVTNQGSFSFTDNGEDTETADGDISMELVNGDNYCYRVLTQGQYEDFLTFGVLSNYSQVSCATPMSFSPPCIPLISVAGGTSCEERNPEDFCNESTFVNVITWEDPTENEYGVCRNDIVSYRIYYSRYQSGEPALVGTVQAQGSNSFTHRRNRKDGFAGCYYVTAVNSLGIESGFSERICFDNCEKISFPNAFSPNGDGRNDTFTPMNCAAFVKSAQIQVYSAHGQKVRDFTGETIEWDGRDNGGKELPSGTYYYHISVNFERLDPNGSTREFKGYVTLIR